MGSKCQCLQPNLIHQFGKGYHCSSCGLPPRMNMNIDADWFVKRAAMEGDLEIGARVRTPRGTAMTAPNNPTPDLEPVAWRWRSGFCGETIQDDWAWMISSVKPERQGNATDFQCEPLYSAATIARLTAERDALRAELDRPDDNRHYWFRRANQQQLRAEAAEKRVRELLNDAK